MKNNFRSQSTQSVTNIVIMKHLNNCRLTVCVQRDTGIVTLKTRRFTSHDPACLAYRSREGRVRHPLASRPIAVQPLWAGLAQRKAEGLRFESASDLLSLQKLWSVDIVSAVKLWLCQTVAINKTLKWLSSLPISRNAWIILCGDSVAIDNREGEREWMNE